MSSNFSINGNSDGVRNPDGQGGTGNADRNATKPHGQPSAEALLPAALGDIPGKPASVAKPGSAKRIMRVPTGVLRAAEPLEPEVFLRRLAQANRVSDVVPSLYTQAGIPQDVIDEFGAAYKREQRRDFGGSMTSTGYRPLSEIAEESGINRFLGFPYCVVNICLEFGPGPNRHLWQCSQRLAPHSELVVSAEGNIVHQTLTQTAMDRRNLKALAKDFNASGALHRFRRFEVRGVATKVNDDGMGEIFYDGRQPFVACANPMIALPRKYACMPLTTPPGQVITDRFLTQQFESGNVDILYNLSVAGFAEITHKNEGGLGMAPAGGGSRCNLHSTIFKIREEGEPADSARHTAMAESLLPPPEQAGGQFVAITLYEMGPNGTVVGEPLARIPLLA